MAQDIIIRGQTYLGAEKVDIPLANDPGTAEFYDTSDGTMTSANQSLNGVISYSKGVKYTGNIQTKTSSDLTASGATVTAPAGYYASNATKCCEWHRNCTGINQRDKRNIVDRN